MKLACTLCGLLVAVAVVNGNPIVKRAADDLNPINEIADNFSGQIESAASDPNEAESVADEDDRADRDKRKIGIIKLGVSNGIINFVFGKLDSFIDAKTKALAALDEGNKAKNLAFGIDASQSATGQYLSELISQKIQAGTASIGPLVSGATTFFTAASSGIGNAIASKVGSLSSLSGGITGGNGGSGGGIISSLGGILGSLSGGSGQGSIGAEASASVGGTGTGGGLGVYADLGGSTISTTTEEAIPEFDRTRVALDVPPALIGNGFTLITNMSRVLSDVIMNSARRTERLLELFKPAFRGAFAIKGLPSDRLQ